MRKVRGRVEVEGGEFFAGFCRIEGREKQVEAAAQETSSLSPLLPLGPAISPVLLLLIQASLPPRSRLLAALTASPNHFDTSKLPSAKGHLHNSLVLPHVKTRTSSSPPYSTPVDHERRGDVHWRAAQARLQEKSLWLQTNCRTRIRGETMIQNLSCQLLHLGSSSWARPASATRGT